MKEILSFRQDKTFKIMQFTDIHYTLDDEADHQSIKLMEKLIAEENPDLMIVTGDTVYGEKNQEYLHKALSPLIASGIPWTWTFGNHDTEFAGTKEALFEELLKLPGCIAYHEKSSVDGMGNHILKIQDESGCTKWLVAALDSGDYLPNKEIGGYACITRNQIQWYQDAIRSQETESRDFSVIAFQHMAIPEFEEMFRYEKCYGVRREGAGCPRINSGFFYAMLEAGHTKALFVGHDHANDYYGNYFGITLGYGRISGYGGYGAPDHLKGARVFVIRADDTEHFKTYVRLENGLVIDVPWGYQPIMRRDEG